MMAQSLHFIDLFSGVGGFHVGLSRLGHRCVLACEKEADLRALYSHNFGIVPHGDIRRLKAPEIPPHDILCAGFPCQPFSKAGDQLGLACARDGDLFRHILRIIRVRRPRYLLLENVANLLKHADGDTYTWMRSRLNGLGYNVEERVLSPHQFGIPQIRERAFIVASVDSLSHFEWPQGSGAEPDICNVLDNWPSDAKELPEHYTKCIDVWQDFLDRIPKNEPLPSFPIWAFEYDATYPITGAPPMSRTRAELCEYRGAFGARLRCDSHQDQMARLPGYARVTNPFPAWKQTFITQNRNFFRLHRSRLKTWIPTIRDFAPSLQKLEWNCKGEARRLSKHILQFRASGVRVKRANWAPALVAMTTTQIPVVTWQRRYMTVKECARLQGLDALSFEGLAASKAYRAIGNAVSADLVERAASALIATVAQRSRRNSRLLSTAT